MRALIMDTPKTMRVGELPTPEPGAGEIRVAVGATGICAGDLYIYQGKNPYASYPLVAGHEIAGVVDALGEGVTEPALGTRVVVEPFIGCGRCYPCRVGKRNCCMNLEIIGVHHLGGYADYVVAPAENIHVVPEGTSLELASFAEPIAIAVQALRRGEVGAEYVLILGAGPIGLALLEVARARGAQVVVTDINEERLAFARELGAETLLADEYLLERVLERTNGEGAPVVIEATGNPKVMESTVELVAAGGRIIIVGLVGRGVMVSFPGLDFTRKEMTVLGSRASVGCFPEALSLLASGKLRYPDVATRFSMWDAPDIFAQLTKNPAMIHKGILLHDHDGQ